MVQTRETRGSNAADITEAEHRDPGPIVGGFHFTILVQRQPCPKAIDEMKSRLLLDRRPRRNGIPRGGRHNQFSRLGNVRFGNYFYRGQKTPVRSAPSVQPATPT